MAVLLLVVAHRPARQRLLRIRELDALRTSRARKFARRFERVERNTRVSATLRGNPFERLVVGFESRKTAIFVRECAIEDRPDVLRLERLEADEERPRHERRVHLEERIFGRRADEDDHAVLDGTEKRVLLSAVEAVDLVHEQDGSSELARVGDHLSHIGHAGRDRGQLRDRSFGAIGDDVRDRRLPDAGGAPQDRGPQLVPLDQRAECRPFADRLFLPDDLVERTRTHARSEGSSRFRSGRLVEEVAHEVFDAGSDSPRKRSQFPPSTPGAASGGTTSAMRPRSAADVSSTGVSSRPSPPSRSEPIPTRCHPMRFAMYSACARTASSVIPFSITGVAPPITRASNDPTIWPSNSGVRKPLNRLMPMTPS